MATVSAEYIKLALLKHYTNLQRTLRTKDIKDNAFQQSIINQTEFEQLKSKDLQFGINEATGLLIDIIIQKSDQQIKTFLKIIEAVQLEVFETIVNTNAENIFKDIGNQFKQIYKDDENKYHLVEVLPGEEFRLDLHKDKYLMPFVFDAKQKQHHSQEQDLLPNDKIKHFYNSVQFSTIQDIVSKLGSNKKSGQLLYCFGIAGSGHTIFTRQIVCSWVDDNNKLKQFDIVIELPLKLAHITESLSNILAKTHFGNKNLTNDNKRFFYQCLKTKQIASKVLIIIDGIDEVDIPKDSELSQLITGKLYPYVNKVITARPEGSFFKDCEHFYPDYLVQIYGTSNEGVYNYLSAVLTTDVITPAPNEVKNLISRWEADMIEFDLLKIPLYLTLAAFLLSCHWAKYCKFSNFEVPKTKTSLFNAFICIFVRIWLKRLGRSDEAKKLNFNKSSPIHHSSNLSNDMKIKLVLLGKMSYYFLEKQTYTIKNDDIKDYLIEDTDIKQSGFFCISTKNYFYRHKQLQEYMAALYLSHDQFEIYSFSKQIDATVSKKSNDKTLLEIFPNLVLVLKFLSGLDPTFVAEIFHRLKGHVCVAKVKDDIVLTYMSSVFSEVESPCLKKTMIDFLATCESANKDKKLFHCHLSTVSNFCKKFSTSQRKILLKKWFDLDLSRHGDNWAISNTQPNDCLKLEYFKPTLYVILLGLKITNVKFLEIRSGISFLTHIGLLHFVFHGLEKIVINHSGGRHGIEQDDNLNSLLSTINTAQELRTISGTERNLLSSDTTLTHVVMKNLYRRIVLPKSSVTSFTQQKKLEVIRLINIDLLPNLKKCTNSTTASSPWWQYLKHLELCVSELGSEDSKKRLCDLFWVIENHMPCLNSLTLGSEKSKDVETNSEIAKIITDGMCGILSKLKILRLFQMLDNKGILLCCKHLNRMKNLFIFGLDCSDLIELGKELEEVIKVISTFSNITKFHVGHTGKCSSDDAANMRKTIVSTMQDQDTTSHIEVGIYDDDNLDDEEVCCGYNRENDLRSSDESQDSQDTTSHIEVGIYDDDNLDDEEVCCVYNRENDLRSSDESQDSQTSPPVKKSKLY